jgi:hypothetical protein
MPRRGTSARILCGNVGISAGGSTLGVLAERVGSAAPRVVPFSRTYPLTRQIRTEKENHCLCEQAVTPQRAIYR